MTARLPEISVCICTFKRADFLLRLLKALERQKTEGAFTFSVVITDNDSTESARPVVEKFTRNSSLAVIYGVETQQNIALARNRALTHAAGSYIAFIDDDEFPEPGWLMTLLQACQQYKSDGVLGPVRPHFEDSPPPWIIKGGFCERPEHNTGRRMNWEECRTGNLLFRKDILEGHALPFLPEFGTGGEDKDFFMRMTQSGHSFVWCNEAVVYETVPPSRWSRSFMIKRALLRGKNSLKHPIGRIGMIAKSLLAVPLYVLALPFLLLFGQHWFMRYCVKLCDHLGRLLALCGVNPVSERV